MTLGSETVLAHRLLCNVRSRFCHSESVLTHQSQQRQDVSARLRQKSDISDISHTLPSVLRYLCHTRNVIVFALFSTKLLFNGTPLSLVSYVCSQQKPLSFGSSGLLSLLLAFNLGSTRVRRSAGDHR